MRFFSALFTAVFVVVMPHVVHAQGHSLYCSHAKSTAEVQKCLTRHVDSAQNRLNMIYTKLTTATDGDALTALKELQAKWLEYRDSECAWEKSLSEEEALHRANELSCLARITEDRADMLAVILEEEKENAHPREFGSFPRWMNVVAKENPSVFWNYEERTSLDLDCDGEVEYVMSGVSLTAQDEVDDTSSERLEHTAEYHVAVAESPVVGKPVVQFFSFPVTTGDEENGVCSSAAHIHLLDDGENDAHCSARLKIVSSGCDDRVIYWNGDEYALEKPEKIIQEEENKKETKK